MRVRSVLLLGAIAFAGLVYADEPVTTPPVTGDGQVVDAELKLPTEGGLPDVKITMTKDFVPEGCDKPESKKTKAGNYLHVHYTGFIDESSTAGEKGKQFDTTVNGEKPEPFTFSLGEGEVVQGWEQGLLDMCVGEKRTLVVPPELAYGEYGAGEAIPGGATLKFNIELVKIDDAAPTDTSLFDEIDTDDDKKLSMAEIKVWLSSSQELDDKLATETAESTLTSEDQNKDGFIDLQEFMSNSAGDGADEDFADDHDDFDDEGKDAGDQNADGTPVEGTPAPDAAGAEPIKAEL